MDCRDENSFERLIRFVRHRIAYSMDIAEVSEAAKKAFPDVTEGQVYLAYKAATILDADLMKKV
jgi:hypothetical protein